MWSLHAVGVPPREPQKLIFSSIRNYTLGRKDCDIILSTPSVSRKHATIKIATTADSKSSISVEDSSKVGCFLNNERIATGTTVSLKESDEILLGAQDRFTVAFIPLAICFSGMRSTEKLAAQSNVTKIGGRTTDSLDDCTHLVMNEFALTAKGLMALIYGKSIITPQWLEQLLNRPSPQSPLPQVEKFQPPIKDSCLQGASLVAAANRKNFFASNVFLFFSKSQFDKAAEVIKAAKGEAYLYDDVSKQVPHLTKSKELFLVQPHSPTPEIEKKVQSVEDLGVLVPENEIGYAIVLQNRNRWPKSKKSTLPTKTSVPVPSLPPSQQATKSLDTVPTPALPKQSPTMKKKRLADEALAEEIAPVIAISPTKPILKPTAPLPQPPVSALSATSPKKQKSPTGTSKNPTLPSPSQASTLPASPKKTPVTPVAQQKGAASSPKKLKVQSAPPVAKPVSLASKRASLDCAAIVRPMTPVTGQKVNFKRFRKSDEAKIISPVKPVICIDPDQVSTPHPNKEDSSANESFIAKAKREIAAEDKDRQQVQDLFQSNVFSSVKGRLNI